MSNLLEYLKQTQAIRHGEFKLSSGKKSDLYIDCRKLTLDSIGLNLIIPELLTKMRLKCPDTSYFQAVGGLVIGADPIVGAMLYYAGNNNIPLKGFLVRKEPKGHGLKQFVEGTIQSGMKIAIVEDVMTTGASAKLAIDKVYEYAALAGAAIEIVVVGAIINRNEGGDELFAKMGIPLVSLLNRADLNF